jgi:hypothetical protein
LQANLQSSRRPVRLADEICRTGPGSRGRRQSDRFRANWPAGDRLTPHRARRGPHFKLKSPNLGPAAAGALEAAAGGFDTDCQSRAHYRENRGPHRELLRSQTQQKRASARSIAGFLSCEPEPLAGALYLNSEKRGRPSGRPLFGRNARAHRAARMRPHILSLYDNCIGTPTHVVPRKRLVRPTSWLIRSRRPTPGRQPASQRRAKCQAPCELRNGRRDDGRHRSEHEYEDRKDRGCQQLGIAVTSQRQNP